MEERSTSEPRELDPESVNKTTKILEDFLSSEEAKGISPEERLTLAGKLHKFKSLAQEPTPPSATLDPLEKQREELEKQRVELEVKQEKSYNIALNIKSVDLLNKIEIIDQTIKKYKRQENIQEKYLGYNDKYLEERIYYAKKLLKNPELKIASDRQEAESLIIELKEEIERRSKEKQIVKKEGSDIERSRRHGVSEPKDSEKGIKYAKPDSMGHSSSNTIQHTAPPRPPKPEGLLEKRENQKSGKVLRIR